MPAEYIKMRDKCIRDKKDKNNGKISQKEIQDCKKWSAIQYWKKHHKTVKQADSSLALNDHVYYDESYFQFFNFKDE